MRIEPPKVKPKIISWAVERSGYNRQDLEAKFKSLPEWEQGLSVPTRGQLEKFANAMHVPYAFMFLDKPPKESISIPDFRTFKGHRITRPSPNLIDVLRISKFRQEWYREFSILEGYEPVKFIGSAKPNSNHKLHANRLQSLLKFSFKDRMNLSKNDDIMRYLIAKLEELGVLVMVSGIVGSNTRRKLDLEEFRGFALCDQYAPLIFVNGSDIKAAQLFTLAHELGHLLLDATGLSNVSIQKCNEANQKEKWCNNFAAELLVPLSDLKEHMQTSESIEDSIDRISKLFKVSRLVILRRLLDANQINQSTFNCYWKLYIRKFKNTKTQKHKGGDFYLTTVRRLGRKFATALIESTINGRTGYRDALQMLGISTMKVFDGLARETGVSN